MKVNEITEGYYDASPFAQKMARYGRTLQQLGQGSGEPGSLKKRKGEGGFKIPCEGDPKILCEGESNILCEGDPKIL